MRILLKCPTRSRPNKVLQTLSSYVRLANHLGQLGIAVSCDTNDASMKNVVELENILRKCAWGRIFYSENQSKIEACNANMNEIDWEWDIVVLVSDDMIPQIRGYDDVIRNHMKARFPDTNGILWFNDGYQAEKLNTLCIYGREFYKSQGCIYNPAYKSLFCDTELTDQCRNEYKNICQYIPYCIIRHEHPGTGYGGMDSLYTANQRYWSQDMMTYITRKKYPYDWSVLIPTIPGREQSLSNLLSSLHEKTKRICPDLRLEICLGFDNRETSIGMKRENLLQNAKGKYVSFVDDDDQITDEYVEDIWATIQGNHHVMRLRGMMSGYVFCHSTENKLTDPMARGNEFIRPPNHLNPMITDIAKFIHYKDSLRGEDLDWTIRMAQTGFLQNEYRSDPSRIHYIYNLGTRNLDPRSLEFQKNTSYTSMLDAVWTPNGAKVLRPPELRLTSRGFVSK
jgi:hypothetical protein